ncbi:MAG: tetratricopeptide repeat protein [Pirellulales bacterium]
MAKQITCLGVLAVARWLLAIITVCLIAELCAGASPEAAPGDWEVQLRRASVLRPAPRPDAVTARLLADAADGHFGSHRLIRAALIASGAEDSVLLAEFERRFDAWCADLQRSGELRGDNPRRAKAIHDYLHARVFHGGYRDDATDLACVFQTGEFNCVSSTICFLALAGELGVAAQAIELPGHCLVELPSAAGVVEIETTCPQWFDVLDSPQRSRDMVLRVTGFEHRAAQSRRRVNDVRLLGIIYYNRGVEQLARGEYRAAAESNLLAIRVDPTNQIARGNLLATLNNWALDLSGSQRHDEALDLLDAAITIAPDHRNFLSNEIHITQNRVEQLLAQNEWRQALRRLDHAVEKRPAEPYYLQARWSLVERQGDAFLAADRLDAATDMFDAVAKRYPHAAEPSGIEVGVWNRAALARLDRGDYSAALALLEFALHRMPDSDTLANNRAAIMARWNRHVADRQE